MKDLWKKCLAELLGTFVLVFFACGTAAITGCIDGGSLVATALAFGLVIVAMAYTIGRISGCHINPAVSLACFMSKRMTAKEFGLYVASQFVGGFLGALLLFGISKMTGDWIVGNACNMAIGFNGEFTAGNIIGTILLEVVLTTIFVFVILTVTDGHESIGKKAGLIIGLTLTLVHLVGIGFTGTSVNPARSFATALGALIYDYGGKEAMENVWLFLVAPMGGGALAALLYKAFFGKKEVKADAE